MAAFTAILLCLQAVLLQHALAQYLPAYGLQQAPIAAPISLANPGYNIVNPVTSYGASIPWPAIPSLPAIPALPAIQALPANCGDVSVTGNTLGVGGDVGVNGVMPVSGCVGFSGNLPALGYATVIGGCSCTSPLLF